MDAVAKRVADRARIALVGREVRIHALAWSSAAAPVKKRIERRVLCALPLRTRARVGGKDVAVRYGARLGDNGLLTVTVRAAGLLDAIADEIDVQLVVEKGALVRVLDVTAKRAREAEEREREREIEAIRALAPEIAKALGRKGRGTLVDDDERGAPYVSVAGRLELSKLLDVQRRFAKRATVVADDWDTLSDKPRGVRVYGPGTAADLVTRVVSNMGDNDEGDVAKAVGALEKEVDARLVHVDHDRIVLLPTKRGAALTKSKRALRRLSLDEVDTDAFVRGAERSVKTGRSILFWWD